MKDFQVAEQLAELLGHDQPWQYRTGIDSCLVELRRICGLESWYSLECLLAEFKSCILNDEEYIWATLQYVAAFFGTGMRFLQEGCEDKSVFFAPLHNELRALAKLPFFSDHTLFFPAIEQPVFIGEIKPGLRATFQQGLYGLLHNQNKRLSFARIEQAIAEVNFSADSASGGSGEHCNATSNYCRVNASN